MPNKIEAHRSVFLLDVKSSSQPFPIRKCESALLLPDFVNPPFVAFFPLNAWQRSHPNLMPDRGIGVLPDLKTNEEMQALLCMSKGYCELRNPKNWGSVFNLDAFWMR
jgi:hypothetical protein